MQERVAWMDIFLKSAHNNIRAVIGIQR